MSTEFNYARAHREWAVPEYKKLPICIKALLMRIGEYDPPLARGKDLNIAWPDESLKEAFAAQSTADLLAGIRVIYWVGHWAYPLNPEQVKEAGDGNYWRFDCLAKNSIIERGTRPLKWRESDTSKFTDHKEGTPYDNDELSALLMPFLGNLFSRVRVENVNHRVTGYPSEKHPFVIGSKHFPKDGGMYIDVHLAGCTKCGHPYELHVSDRVVVLPMKLRDGDKLTDAERVALQAPGLENLMTEHKLDGFVFVKG